MTVTLTPEQHAWLSEQVARGDFRSIDEAARQLIDERIAERMIENDDLAWAKPYVDEAIAEVERGNFISIEEHESRMAARMQKLKD